MYHSITFGDKNTWDDWHLIPKTRPLFNPPEQKTHVVEIPGGDGSIDLSTSFTGRPTYKNRTGDWTFIVQNGYKEWSNMYTDIMTYLHGKTFKAILEDDPKFYYEGRFTVNSWKSDKDWSEITIAYDVGPYKKYNVSDDDWEWDDFNFETGIIRYYKELVVDGELDVLVVLDDGYNAVPVIPTFVSSNNNITMTVGGKKYALNKGSNYYQEIIITREMSFNFIGDGIITIDIVGGRL